MYKRVHIAISNHVVVGKKRSIISTHEFNVRAMYNIAVHPANGNFFLQASTPSIILVQFP
jgi:hypothetical protein